MIPQRVLLYSSKTTYKWITNFVVTAIFALLVFVGQASAGPNAILSLDLISNGGRAIRQMIALLQAVFPDGVQKLLLKFSQQV